MDIFDTGAKKYLPVNSETEMNVEEKAAALENMTTRNIVDSAHIAYQADIEKSSLENGSVPNRL